ncbi:MAG: tRNA pseudouridine(38-40) synthase TruA [Acidobacteriota bacterium]|nr:MAG: tRNA pseudouridine(38-40) synthase TruA [Acidobacteriota bacterium]
MNPETMDPCRVGEKIVLEVAYDGTPYAGWQLQPGQPTVQGVLIDALAQIHDTAPDSLRVTGAGRTDAGVHALGQVASYTSATPRSFAAVSRGLEALLPESIRVLAAGSGPEAFHPRRDALLKRYIYRIVHGRPLLPFEAPWRWHIRAPLDVGAMAAAARALAGRHDFAAFAAAGRPTRSTTRTLHRLDAARVGAGDVRIVAEADGFLYKMVRNLVGLLVDIGLGRRPVDDARDVLAGRDRGASAPTAPARGLCLKRVVYPVPIAAQLLGVGHGPLPRS